MTSASSCTMHGLFERCPSAMTTRRGLRAGVANGSTKPMHRLLLDLLHSLRCHQHLERPATNNAADVTAAAAAVPKRNKSLRCRRPTPAPRKRHHGRRHPSRTGLKKKNANASVPPYPPAKKRAVATTVPPSPLPQTVAAATSSPRKRSSAATTPHRPARERHRHPHRPATPPIIIKRAPA